MYLRWLWKYNTASEGWMNMGRMGSGCLCQVTSLRPEQFQQNESHFYNLDINWDWMSYVTCLDTFFDLKLRISEVWPIDWKILVNSINQRVWSPNTKAIRTFMNFVIWQKSISNVQWTKIEKIYSVQLTNILGSLWEVH